MMERFVIENPVKLKKYYLNNKLFDFTGVNQTFKQVSIQNALKLTHFNFLNLNHSDY